MRGVKKPRLSWEDRKRLRDVGVLVEYVRMEIDSTLLVSVKNARLLRDVERIPERFRQCLEADVREVVKHQKRARARRRGG